MSNDSTANSPDDSPIVISKNRTTVAEYLNMRQTGGPDVDVDVEFVEGLIMRKMRRSLRHDGAIEKVHDVLYPLVPGEWQLLSLPTLTTADSQVEPDVVIARKRLESEADRPLLTTEVGLLVEVADASLLFDRRNKGRVYARANIPCYWLLNLPDGQLEVFTKPSGPKQMPGYQEERVYRLEDKVAVIVEEDWGQVRVGDMIP